MQTAEQTREIAANTLDALHQQGQKLEVVERDLYEVCSFGLIHSICMDYAYATVCYLTGLVSFLPVTHALH
jgi:hypothetical protein